MTTFLALATALIVVTVVLLVLPLLRRQKTPDAGTATGRKEANLAIFRDQLAELESERDEGSLTAADFDQARTELQRRLLEEVKDESVSSGESAPSKKAVLLIAVLLPVAGLLGYALLGNPKALDPVNRQAQHQVTAAQVESMVEKLAQRLQQNPDDPQGWVMLARSYKMLGRYAESAEAYGKGFSLIENEPALLADYAEMLAISGSGFSGKASEMLDKALKLAPNEPQVLLLAGAAAGERGDFKAAVAFWEKVLAQLEPGSEEATAISSAIAQAREAMKNNRGEGATNTGK